MLYAHVTPKRIKIIQYIPKFMKYLYKKWSCLQHVKYQNILIYNLLFKLNPKEQSFEINYCVTVNYLQLNRIAFQNKTCF